MGLLNWFKRRFTSDPSIYHPHQMTIYTYWNGQKYIKADPMTLYKRLMDVGPELAVDIQVANSVLVKNAESMKANDNVVRKVRDVFNITSLENGGLTEAATANLLDHFLTFTEGLKKNLNPSQTSSLPESVSAVISGVNRPTQSSSESGSIANGCLTAKQEQLPSEPQLPLESSNQASNTTAV